MSVRRVLVECAVLSLLDSCVFYPCCKSCFSRIDTEQLDVTTRCRCSRCGSRCLRDQVDYRYRLSLRVTRDNCVFDVTVFGSSLNVFFGIPATGLQKLVENLEGPEEPSTRSRLLLKAVRDCFIGRYFIFGIKLSGTGSGPWFGDPGSDGSSRRERAQFVASQMILPKAAGLSGCTVLSYYQILLQKASEYEEGSADPAAPLLLVPGTSSSLSNASLWASGLLSQSQLRPQDSDLSLWEQSLGVVTSSAEQEEETGGSQDGGADSSRRTEKSPTSHTELLEERTSLLPSEQSFYNSPFIRYPNLSFGATAGSSSGMNSCFSPFQPVHKSSSLCQKEFSTSQLARSILSSSSAWEDLPFSESLTEFLHKQNKDVEVFCEIKPSLNVLNGKQTARTYLEIPTPTVRLNSAGQRNPRVRTGRSSALSDISNTPAPGEGDGQALSDREHDRPEDKNISSHECFSSNDKAFLSFAATEEQLEEDSFNCSADLFSSSLRSSRNEENTESVRPTTGTPQQHLGGESGSQLTPHKHKHKVHKCSNSIGLTLHQTEHFDFVPPSQSTPVVKASVATLLPHTPHRIPTAEFSKQRLRWSRRSNSCSNRSTPGRRFRKTQKHKEVGRDASTRSNCEHRSRVGRGTVWDLEEDDDDDDDGIVAPTPDGKTRWSVASAGDSSDLGLIRKAYRRNGVDYRKLVSDQTLPSSPRHQGQTGHYETETVHQNVSDDSHQTCDWSRDLFSDSVAQ